MSRRSAWQYVWSALWLTLTFVLSGCYQTSDYSGDGRLVDNGMLAATDRYVLDLGRIDLRQTGSRKYRLANLPESEFVLGIDISPTADTKQAINQESVKAVVAIELIPLKGEPIFSRTGPLNTWTWSSRDSGRQVFVYGREAPQTYFKPEPNAAYTLALTIVQPDKEGATYAASLKAKAGGWK